MTVRTSTLANGLRVVTDHMDRVETVSVGVWVNAGTRNERAEVNGVSHLLEHMAFKGTKRRSALDIAEQKLFGVVVEDQVRPALDLDLLDKCEENLAFGTNTSPLAAR